MWCTALQSVKSLLVLQELQKGKQEIDSTLKFILKEIQFQDCVDFCHLILSSVVREHHIPLPPGNVKGVVLKLALMVVPKT